MTFTEIFVYTIIQYEIITFKASRSWITHDICTKFFTHAFHIIVNNFVKMTFDLRGHWMSEKNCLKYDLYGNFYLWNHSIWNHNFQSFYIMNNSWYFYEIFYTCISHNCQQLCKNDLWPQRSLNVRKKLLNVWPLLKFLSMNSFNMKS